MDVTRSKLLVALTLGLSCASATYVNGRQPLERHWTVTASETLWTIRYNNCDYGYYVSLPDGVVGHDTPPPSPNHGFLIALPDVGTVNYVLDRKKRFIWVDASYNVSDAHSLSDLVAERDSGLTRLSKTRTKIAGLPAIRVKSANGMDTSEAVEVTTVALRDSIVYTIGMRTNRTDDVADEVEYRRIVGGFKLLALPRGQCSNG